MRTPFPGMDPYLEDSTLWPDFQRHLVACLYQILLPGLVDRYTPRIVRRSCSTGAATPEEEYIEVRQRCDQRFVTLMDVVSPTNRTTDAGRQAYLTTRREARDGGANLVELDLVLQGTPMQDYSREHLPEWDYAVTVTRATQPERHEIYTATIQKRLPRFRLPLAADDRDTVLDLQTAFARAFDQGDFSSRIDYSRDPAVPLRDQDCRRIETHLVGWHLREPGPPHEEIARAAYSLWEQEGRPHGRHLEHWQKALAELRRRKEI